jgi:hypothetical protein
MRTLFGIILIFASGFLAGVLFETWRNNRLLDKFFKNSGRSGTSQSPGCVSSMPQIDSDGSPPRVRNGSRKTDRPESYPDGAK